MVDIPSPEFWKGNTNEQVEDIEAAEIILNMLYQACETEDETVIDNRCLSAYEDACDYLTKKGCLKKINGRLYKMLECECIDCDCEHKQQIQGWTGKLCFQGDVVIACMDCGKVKNISQGDKEFKEIK